MIVLTKRNDEKFLVNHNQIQCIEMIPESKVVMMNRDYYIVKETPEQIIGKIAEYTAKVQDIHRQVTVVDKPRPGETGGAAGPHFDIFQMRLSV